MKKILLFLFAFGIILPSEAQIINTVVGDAAPGGDTSDNISAIHAAIVAPQSLAFDPAGNMYFGQAYSSKIRKVNTAGIITTIAGKGGAGGYTGDNGPAIDAQINETFIAADALGNIYFTDYEHNIVRKVDASGIISTFAGNGVAGNSGNGGPATAANLHGPIGIAVDNDGNVFISDSYNYEIRKVNASGIISIFAGNGTSGNSGDGNPAINASIVPLDIAIDDEKNIFVNSNWVIRKISTSGIISTVAGGGTTFPVDNMPATNVALYSIAGITADHNGNLFLCSQTEQIIYKISPFGIITTFAGNGFRWPDGNGDFSGDGGLAVLARLNLPTDAAVDEEGNIYIADYNNARIRKVTKSPNATTIIKNTTSPIIFPNPTSSAFTVTTRAEPIETITITDMLGHIALTKDLHHCNLRTYTHNEDNNLSPGIYIISISTSSQTITDKIIIK